MNILSQSELSEICGIFAGDGTLYKTKRGIVLEVRGGLDEITYYKRHVKNLFSKLFSSELKVIRRKYKGGCTVGIRKCGRTVLNIFHNELGFPVGKKSDVVEIPDFVINSNNPDVWTSYLRGIFDTDGCIYLNRVKRGIKIYTHPRIQFTSKSMKHLSQIKRLLARLGFNSHIERNNSKVTLGGWSTSQRFIDVVKPANERHNKRIKSLMPKLFNMLRWPKVQTGNLVWR